MNPSLRWLAVLLLFGISVVSVWPLKCYVCNSANRGEEDCESLGEGSKKYLVDCTAPKDQTCRIQEQFVDFDVVNQTQEKRVIRQCASIEYTPERPCYSRSGFGGRVNVCHCTGDACNESSRTLSSVLLSIAAFLILKIFV